MVAGLGNAEGRDRPDDHGALFWHRDAWVACLKVLAERPRRRKLQQLPPEAIAVLYREEESQEEIN